MKTTMATPRVAPVNGSPVRLNETKSKRTFTITLDIDVADSLADFCEEFGRVTPEATITQIVSDALDSASTDDSYRYSLSQDASERAMKRTERIRQTTRPRRNRFVK